MVYQLYKQAWISMTIDDKLQYSDASLSFGDSIPLSQNGQALAVGDPEKLARGHKYWRSTCVQKLQQ